MSTPSTSEKGSSLSGVAVIPGANPPGNGNGGKVGDDKEGSAI